MIIHDEHAVFYVPSFPKYLIPEESLSGRKFLDEACSLNFIAPALRFDLEKIATRLASAGGCFWKFADSADNQWRSPWDSAQFVSFWTIKSQFVEGLFFSTATSRLPKLFSLWQPATESWWSWLDAWLLQNFVFRFVRFDSSGSFIPSNSLHNGRRHFVHSCLPWVGILRRIEGILCLPSRAHCFADEEEDK